ncbi:MAG TPA: porin PorA family protein [Streptosporangiaceae bacterium]|nr:porin PorA family protein [Streptosporangiaceae bacterium]
MRKAAIFCSVTGVILLAAAGLLAFWIAPQYIARLPSDSNTVRTYNGHIRSLADPVALRQGNFAGVLKAGLPETLHQRVKVLQTSGNTALVQEANTVDVSGRQIGTVTSQYAVNRSSLEATDSHPGNWSVTDASGLTVNWPIGAKKQNYTGWVNTTHTTTQLKYVGQQQRGGLNTYVYQATVPTTVIKNPQVLGALPKSLPVRVLKEVGKTGLVPPKLLAGLARAFPHVADVPLGYTYAATSTYWVAPATGVVVDVSTSETQMGGVALPQGKVVPLLPVLVDSYQGSQGSVQAAATDAKNGSNTITTFGTAVPIAAAAVGFVLVVIAVVLWMRARRRGTGQIQAQPPADARA